MPAHPDPPSAPDPEASEALRQLRRGMARVRAIVGRAKARLGPGPDTPAPPRAGSGGGDQGKG